MLYNYISDLWRCCLSEIPLFGVFSNTSQLEQVWYLLKNEVAVFMQVLRFLGVKVMTIRPTNEALLANMKLLFGATASLAICR